MKKQYLFGFLGAVSALVGVTYAQNVSFAGQRPAAMVSPTPSATPSQSPSPSPTPTTEPSPDPTPSYHCCLRVYRKRFCGDGEYAYSQPRTHFQLPEEVQSEAYWTTEACGNSWTEGPPNPPTHNDCVSGNMGFNRFVYKDVELKPGAASDEESCENHEGSGATAGLQELTDDHIDTPVGNPPPPSEN